MRANTKSVSDAAAEVPREDIRDEPVEPVTSSTASACALASSLLLPNIDPIWPDTAQPLAANVTEARRISRRLATAVPL
jgi:hypothetical protein